MSSQNRSTKRMMSPSSMDCLILLQLLSQQLLSGSNALSNSFLASRSSLRVTGAGVGGNKIRGAGSGGYNNRRWNTVHRPHPSSYTSPKSTSSRGMFTGIVEEMGTVVSLDEREDMALWDGSVGTGTELTVRGKVVMDGAYLGCSISVNGVCLTATELHPSDSVFKVGLAPETLRCTYLGNLRAGDAVNLERASEIGGRNSGHFVQGHVDGVGTVVDRWTDGDSLFFKVRVEDDLLRYIVPKGFVAVDGTSLTVCEVDNRPEERWFTFMLVEYTQKKIIIPEKGVGALLNIEVDVLGKYAETALANVLPRIEYLEGRVNELERKLQEKS